MPETDVDIIEVDFDPGAVSPLPRGRLRARWSWTLAIGASLAFHGALLAAGLAFFKLHARPPRIELSWGEAGSGDGDIVQGGHDSGADAPPAAPVDTSVPQAPPVQESPTRLDAAALDALLVQQEVPTAVTDAGGASAPADVIGLSAAELPFPSAAASAGLPRFHPALPPRPGGGAAAAGAAAPTGGGGQLLVQMTGGNGGSGAGRGGSGAAGGGFRSLPAPIYPRECRLRGEEGTVVLEIEVRADGSLGEIRIVDDAGHPRLAEAAVEAVKHARLFAAADEEGRPVAGSIRQPFVFRLRD